MNSLYKVLNITILAGIIILIWLISSTFYPVNKEPQEFKYKEHDYIYFPGKGITHSPDCKHCLIIFD